MQAGVTVSAVTRLHGVSPSLLFKWRQLMSQGGQVAVKADDDVVAASKARCLEQRVRERCAS
jgi:transposase